MRRLSLNTKWLAGGLTVVLLPLIVTGILTYRKTSQEFLDVSMKHLQDTARDLAFLTNSKLTYEMATCSYITTQKRVRDLAASVHGSGVEAAKFKIDELQRVVATQLPRMGSQYYGYFITDAVGNLLVGVYDDLTAISYSVSDRSYFNQVRSVKKAVISNLLEEKGRGVPVIVACAPILSPDSDFHGAVGLIIRRDFLTKFITQRTTGKTGYGYLVDREGRIMAHPDESPGRPRNVTSIKGMETLGRRMAEGETGTEHYIYDNMVKIAGFAPVGLNGWSVGVAQGLDEILGIPRQLRKYSVLIIAFSLLGAAIAVVLFSRSVIRPIKSAVVSLEDITHGDGDLTRRVRVETNDEVGQLSESFNQFLEKLHGMITDIAQGIGTLNGSSGQLTDAAERLFSVSRQTREKSEAVAQNTDKMAENMESVGMTMEESSRMVDSVASASEEMSGTIDEIARNTELARSITEKAVLRVDESGKEVDDLGRAAKSVGQVVETITDISEQVSLLALNATIEAARAGQWGRGFAVVANEIKTLALQTSEATMDIKAKIKNIQGSSEKTVDGISQIRQVIREVNDIVVSIAAAVEEQSEATREINRNMLDTVEGIQHVKARVDQSSSAVMDITGSVSCVQDSAQTMAETSETVKHHAAELSGLALHLQDMVGRFVI